MAQLIAELAEGRSLRELAEDFRLDVGDVQGALEEVAQHFDRSWVENSD